MARVTAAEVGQIRASVVGTVRRAPTVGPFIAGILDVFVFMPMRLWANLGLLRTRERRRPATQRRDRGDGSDGFGTAGVGARLPVVPPSLSGAAALSIPTRPTTEPGWPGAGFYVA
jgi:hypothetical protein